MLSWRNNYFLSLLSLNILISIANKNIKGVTHQVQTGKVNNTCNFCHREQCVEL